MLACVRCRLVWTSLLILVGFATLWIHLEEWFWLGTSQEVHQYDRSSADTHDYGICSPHVKVSDEPTSTVGLLQRWLWPSPQVVELAPGQTSVTGHGLDEFLWPRSRVKCVPGPHTILHTCLYANLYWINGSFFFMADSCPDNEAWHTQHAVMTSDRVVGPCMPGRHYPRPWAPACLTVQSMRSWITISQPGLHKGLYLLATPFFWSQVGHDMWNNAFSAFAAIQMIKRAGLIEPHAALNITYVSTHEHPPEREHAPQMVKFYKTFFGNDAESLGKGRWRVTNLPFVVERIIVGTGLLGSDDVQQYWQIRRLQRLLQHSRLKANVLINPMLVSWEFRKHALLAHDVKEHADHGSLIDVLLIENKRDTLRLPRLEQHLKQALAGTCTVELLKWHHYSSFDVLLPRLQRANIYISGIGTGMMWFRFLDVGSVVINLVDKHLIPFRFATLHDLDSALTPYVRVLYYPFEKRQQGIDPLIVEEMVRQAISLRDTSWLKTVRTNMEIMTSRSMETMSRSSLRIVTENLSPNGKAFHEYCNTVNDSCDSLFAMMTGYDQSGNIACGGAGDLCSSSFRHPDYVIHRRINRCCLKSTLDENTMRTIKKTVFGNMQAVP